MDGNIYLVGFMATGKTSVGKELAKKKKWQFLDLDDLIELREKRQISDIFAKEGEPYFRRVEKATLKEVAKQKKFVVACGGGVMIDPENIRMMRETGKIICLTATVDTILKRASAFSHRPLLNVAHPRKQIEVLFQLRAPFYAQADKTVDTSKITIREATRKVVKLLSERKGERCRRKYS